MPRPPKDVPLAINTLIFDFGNVAAARAFGWHGIVYTDFVSLRR